MHRRITGIGSLVLLLLPSLSRAQAIPDQVVEFRIRADASDPRSNVTFVVTMHLAAVDFVESAIGWEVSTISFRKPASEGKAELEWLETVPMLQTIDGLWWIEHADPQQPVTAEFRSPPWLWGTAPALDGQVDDLDYSFVGSGTDNSNGSPSVPFQNSATLSFYFSRTNAALPEEEGEDEPVESGEGNSDP